MSPPLRPLFAFPEPSFGAPKPEPELKPSRPGEATAFDPDELQRIFKIATDKVMEKWMGEPIDLASGITGKMIKADVVWELNQFTMPLSGFRVDPEDVILCFNGANGFTCSIVGDTAKKLGG